METLDGDIKYIKKITFKKFTGKQKKKELHFLHNFFLGS